MRSTYHYRSFFWPALLILAGIVALLVNTGAISVDRLYQLLDLWPLILIVVGLELILRHSLHGVAGDVAAALIVLLAVVGAIGYVVVSPNPSANHTMDASSSVGNLGQAAAEVDAGAATITVTGSGDLGSDLYRAHIGYSGPRPTVDFSPSSGKLVISQPNGALFQARKFVLDLQLNAGIPWTLTENTGASTDTINLSQAHVAGITLNTGASREDITLGPLSGTVPVEINGGALTVQVRLPAGVATSVDVSGGAVTLNVDGRTTHAIGSLTYESSGFNEATDRYRITVNGGACTVTVGQGPSLG